MVLNRSHNHLFYGITFYLIALTLVRRFTNKVRDVGAIGQCSLFVGVDLNLHL